MVAIKLFEVIDGLVISLISQVTFSWLMDFVEKKTEGC